MDFAVPVDHRVKVKESEKNRQILKTCQRTKKMRNMKVTVIPIVVVCFERSLKAWKGNWNSWKSKEESRPSKLQHDWDRPEYWEEYGRLEENPVKPH